jgi:hypothetical protein
MNDMFKNIRGLRDLDKHSHIANCCRDYYLNFVAISERGKQDYSQSFLDRLCSGINFQWFSCPPRGRSGGMLVGLRSDTMVVLAFDGEYHIKLIVRNKANNFI